jgi:MSHA biogenesis protein MshQ
LNLTNDLTQNYRQTDGSLELKVLRTAPTSNGAIDGNFTYAEGKNRKSSTSATFEKAMLTSFSEGVKGQAEFSGARYDEVGVINLDVQDINYGALGDVEGLVSADDLTVGRFTPAYFKQTVKEEHRGDFNASFEETGVCSFSDWAYTGQRSTDEPSTDVKGAIAYNFKPKITITAFNANDNITKNYTLGEPEGFMKLLNSGVNIGLPTHDKMQEIVGSSITSFEPVAITAVMNTGSLSASPDNAGELLYTFSSNDHFTYDRDSSSLLSPFGAKIPFVTEQIIDTDGIKLATTSATEAFVTEGVQIRFGRLVLQNSFGPETSDLPQPMQIEHFTANGFIVRSDNNCVSYDSTNINLDTTLTTRALPEEPAATTGNFIAGKTRTIKLAAPGAGNQGKIGVSYDASDWLKYDWDPDVEIDGVVYNENPSATATFGLFRGNDRIIYQREVFD